MKENILIAVDEIILYKHPVKNNMLRAGLDITVIRSLSKTSRLWNSGDNVLITSHSAGLFAEYPNRFCNLIIRNLFKYYDGFLLENNVI